MCMPPLAAGFVGVRWAQAARLGCRTGNPAACAAGFAALGQRPRPLSHVVPTTMHARKLGVRTVFVQLSPTCAFQTRSLMGKACTAKPFRARHSKRYLLRYTRLVLF